MSTQFFTSGPAWIWTGTGPYIWGGFNGWNFVGYSRRGISVQISAEWEDIDADHAAKMPADTAILGQSARISGTFSRYDESVVAYIASFGTSFIYGGFDNNAAGILAVSEGISYPLLLYSPNYGFKSQYGTMVPGFLFYAVVLAEPYDVTLSMRPKNPSLGWRALPVFGNGSGNDFVAGVQPLISSRLYTLTLPSPLPNTT